MTRRTFPLALVLAIALGACGDDKQTSSAASSTTATTAESTTTTAAPTTTTTAAGLSENSPLRDDGIGPIKVGMTLAEATAAVGKPVTQGSEPGPSEGCGHAKVQGGPAGLLFLVEREKATDPWRIARVEVDEGSRIATASGIRIGATEAEVNQAYSGADKTGKLETEPHKYTEGGHYITYDVDGPEGNLLLFETDGKKVTEFRSGQQGPVGYVEGCA